MCATEYQQHPDQRFQVTGAKLGAAIGERRTQYRTRQCTAKFDAHLTQQRVDGPTVAPFSAPDLGGWRLDDTKGCPKRIAKHSHAPIRHVEGWHHHLAARGDGALDGSVGIVDAK